MIKFSEILESKFGKALNIATHFHKGQYRKDGTPYMIHPYSVSQTVKQYTSNPNILTASLLHDVVEDTTMTEDDIIKQFGKKVAKLVIELTSDKEAISKSSKEGYLSSVMTKMSDEALMIKLADFLHNTSDLPNKNGEWVEKQRVLRTNVLNTLEKKRNLKKYHKAIIKDIRYNLR